MNKQSVEKSKVFVRGCLWFAVSGVLNLSDEESMILYKELHFVANWLQDKNTIMFACNELGLLFMKRKLYNEAVQYQQIHLSLALESNNKVWQVEAYGALGYAYLYDKKRHDSVLCYEQRKNIAIEVGDKTSELDSCDMLGGIFLILGQPVDAIKHYKQQLSVALEIKDKEAQGTAYGNLARAYEKTNETSEAINCYEEWLKTASKHSERQRGKIYCNLGVAHNNLKNFDKAIQYYKHSLEIALMQSNQKLEIQLYINLGVSYLSQERYLEASDYFVKVMELAIRLDDKILERLAYDKLESLIKLTKDYEKAIEYYKKILKFTVDTGDSERRATALEHLGDVYQIKGDYEEAIKYHEQQLQNSNSKPEQVRAYWRLGYDYDALGSYNKSIKYHKKELQICVAIGDKEAEGFAHYKLGVSYRLIGQFQDALHHSKYALELARETGNHDLEGRAHEVLGDYYAQFIDPEAIEHFSKALEIALELDDEERKAQAYGRLGMYKVTTNKYNEALDLFDKQIKIAEIIQDKTQESWGYRGKGFTYCKMENHNQAVYCYETSLAVDKATCNKRELSSTLYLIGCVYAKISTGPIMKEGEQEKQQQCIAKAIHFFEESLAMFEEQFDLLQKQDSFKISFLEKMVENYHNLTLMLLTSDDHKKALLVSERGKARALKDLLVAKYNINREQKSGSDIITYDEIMSMASDVSILFYSRFKRGRCTWVISQRNISVTIEIDENETFSKFLDCAYDDLKVREVKSEDRLVQTDERQEQHTRSSQPQEFIVIKDISDDLLLTASKISKRCIPDEDLYSDDPNPLEGLHESLISPILDQLFKDQVVIIPDGDLFKLPFAALRNPNTGKHLFETKCIRLAPSLTSLKTLKESPIDFHSKTGSLIIGNPKVGDVMFKGKSKLIPDLPCAEQEAEMIAKLLDVKPFIGPKATKEMIKQILHEGVALIHFAAHGTENGEIFLAPSTTDDLPSEEDYILTMKEVQESGVRPQLVVLSCCHSGRGEIKAEGVVGMSRAFLAAGARAVVASLWAIADEATMVFMQQFYTHLKNGKSASRSLQEAMKDTREMPRYNDEQFWAPFFLIGDDVTITLQN